MTSPTFAMSDVFRFCLTLLTIVLLEETDSLPLKQSDGNNICFNDDKRVLPFRHCSDSFIGKLFVNNSSEAFCPRHSLVLLISIHPSRNKDMTHDCMKNCTSNLFQNKCQQTRNCHIKSSDVWQNLRECHWTEIRFICFNTKASTADEDYMRKRNISKLCSIYLHQLNDNFNLQFQDVDEERKHNLSLEGKFKVRKRELRNHTTTDLPHLVENGTFTSEEYKMSTETTYVEINKTQQLHNNSIQHKETFLGRQISLWFSSINEPHLIGAFIKSNLEKFILYVIVFICIGVIGVMAVVIYSLAYQIKHRRKYIVNENSQQKPGKISYHSPDNWRTPDSGSSTGDDRTLRDEEVSNVHAMDRTDSRHAMCSSITETRSNREENQLSSSHQPINNNSVRGSTTLPSPPNSLIFERASPLAPSEEVESPREKTTPPQADVHYTERLSS